MKANRLLPPIIIHPLLGILFIISFLTGTFTQLFIIFFIVCFHELGHIAMALFYRWEIESITLSFFGGVMQTSEDMKRTWKEQFYVIIAGPLQHLFLHLCIYFFENNGLISSSFAQESYYFNIWLLLFNLLPIYPLDGGKILFLFASLFLPYYQAFKLMIILSLVVTLFVIVLQVIYFPFHLTVLMIWLFLFHENFLDWKFRVYHFIQFLLQRKEGSFYYNKSKDIRVSKQMTLYKIFKKFYRYQRHTIVIKGITQKSEAQILQHFFVTGNRNEKIKNIL